MDTTLPQQDSSLSKSSGYETSKLGAMEEVDNGLDGPDFTIATHFVKVKRSGTLTDVTTLWDLVGTEAVSGSLDSVLDSRPGFDRLPSINAFDKVSAGACEMINNMRISRSECASMGETIDDILMP